MTKEKEGDVCCSPKKWNQGNTCGGVYFFAFVGAAIYFIHQTDTFWMGVLGFLKAIVWPAMLIYKVFTMVGM